MLKFKDFDLLNENLNRARAVLRQAGVPENNPNFLKLRELLKNNLGYAGKFTEWMFLQKVEFSQLQNLYNRIKGERLSKSIDQFKTPEEVIDSLIRTNAETDINQILNAIPGRTRQFLKDCGDYKDLEGFLKQHSGKKDFLIDFFSKKGGRYGDYEGYDVIGVLIRDLEKIVDAKSISDISKMSKSSKDVKFVFEDDKFLVVAVNYNGIKEVGSNYWCIVEDEDTFNDYVIQTEEPTIQLVIYFKDRVPFVDDKSVLGVTWRLTGSGSIDAAHWEDDAEFSNRESKQALIGFLKSLNSNLLEILPTIYDISETDWAFSMPEFFMPKLMNMIEACESSGIVKPIEKFITNWLSWTSDRYDFGEVKSSVFFKQVVPLLKKSGIKLGCFGWEDIIYFELFEITELTKKLLQDNVFSQIDDSLDRVIEDDKQRRNFYLWLIKNGYDLESKVQDSRDIMDLIKLKGIPIEKLYKRIPFNEVGDLYRKDRDFIEIMIYHIYFLKKDMLSIF